MFLIPNCDKLGYSMKMTKLLLAKDVVESNIPLLNNKCLELKKAGLVPKMRVIIVGDNPASVLYIKNKRKLCQRVSADFEIVELPESIGKEEFLKRIEEMNTDKSVTGCFVQLPIPKHLQDIDVTNLIDPHKDVDGFHAKSIINIYKDNKKGFIPCTPKGILKLLDHYKIELEGKHVVVIGRSLIVGKPMSLLLNNKNATVTMCHSKTRNLTEHTKSADIIISAVGKAKFLKSDYLNDSGNQILIDVGINKDENNKTCGDIDFDNVKDKVYAITPVPGGVGPLTVLSLIENLLLATENTLKDGKS